MTVWALYSEIDPFAAAWLTKLIGAGHIMPGVVDTRSLEDLTPDECNEFRQVHLCAGIGVWSHALRMAGWNDDRPCWTASFPCQPFSAAGKGAAFADERHIWPSGHWLIDQCRPPIVFGEQVASKDGLAWLDVVSADLEGSGYAFGAADLCAAGVGSPHIRQRSYWLAYADGRHTSTERQQRGGQQRQQPNDGGASGGMAHAHDAQRRADIAGRNDSDRTDAGWAQSPSNAEGLGNAGGLGDARSAACERDAGALSGTQAGEHGARFWVDGGVPVGFKHAGAGVGGLANDAGGRRREECTNDGGGLVGDIAQGRTAGPVDGGGSGRPSPTNGFWSDADWLYCRDGKWRPVEPGTFPLVNGATNRVGRLRGYGNAIVAPLAQAFIESVME